MPHISEHPADCPEWEYARVTGHPRVVADASAAVLSQLRRRQMDTRCVASDTRPVHRHVFHELVDRSHEYFAGHYRGERFRCLQHYEVRVGGDPSVGAPARQVAGLMRELTEIVLATVDALDEGHALPDAQLSAADKLLYTVIAACRIFEQFLRVHPYANGNGHVGRFLIWAILGRYGYWPLRWTMEPRPPDPPYTELICRYRRGDKSPLEQFVLSCICGTSGNS